MLRRSVACKTSKILKGALLLGKPAPRGQKCCIRNISIAASSHSAPFASHDKQQAMNNIAANGAIKIHNVTARSFGTGSKKRPPSLIRTDFAVDSSASKSSSQQKTPDLILPSGYEIATGTNNTDGDKAPSAPVAYVDYKELYDPKVHLPSAPQDWSEYEPATPLWQEMAAQIGVLGRPMTVAEFFQQALLHPKFGYYSQPSRHGTETDDDEDIFSDDEEEDDDNNNNPIFGPRGDFVTAPEICQVFGESIQVFMATEWEKMGKPKAMQWVEFGPGRGTLMADMVRFALIQHKYDGSADDAKLQEYGNALRVIHFIEASHPLRAKQQDTLQEELGDLVNWKFHNNSRSNAAEEEIADKTKPTIHVHWHDSFGSLSAMIMRRKQKHIGHEEVEPQNNNDSDIASMPLFVICQEFFDALPVHAFEMTDDGWRERMVDVAIKDELLEDEDENGNPLPKPATTSSSNNLPLSQKRPRLRIVLAPEVTPALKTLLHVDEEGKLLTDDDAPSASLKAETGQVIEVCPEGILVAQDIAALLEQQGGAAIVVDYGEKGSTDSLRGFWKHKQTHFLSLPGQTDVTADVDFTALKHAVNFARPRRLAPKKVSGDDGTSSSQEGDMEREIRAYGPIAQGKFLVSMGAKERVIQAIESDSTSDEEAEQLFYALERLVAESEMGTRYKVLAIATERKDNSESFTVPPAGF